MKDLYLIEAKALPYVDLTDTKVIHYLCCEGFLTDHAGVVIVVEFGSKGEVNVG